MRYHSSPTFKRGQQRRVPRQHAEVAFGAGQLDFVHLLGDERAVGRDDFERRAWSVAPFDCLMPRHGFRLLDGLFDRADHVERLLRQVVVLAFDDLLEALDRVGDRHVLALEAGELLGDEERLRQERWILRARETVSLSSSDSSSMPRIAMMSCRSL